MSTYVKLMLVQHSVLDNSVCPSRGLFRDCETSNLVKVRFQFFSLYAMVK